MFSPTHSSIEIRFDGFNAKLEYDEAVFKTVATFTSKILLQIAGEMTGIHFKDLILSRPKQQISNERETTVISYSFSFIANNDYDLKWKTISFALLVRNRYAYRDIADDCIDICITLSDEWEYDDYVPDCFSDEAHEFLSSLKAFLAEKVCEIINFEPATDAKNIIFANPRIEKESMPGTGADCFVLYGVVSE